MVAEVLAGDDVHLTAEAVHGRARRRLPEISLATVYNTLNELVALGEVLEISNGGGPRRFDPQARRPHHHLVCTGCGELRDVHPAGTGGLSVDPREAQGYEVTGVDIVFRGRCATCRSGRDREL